MDLNPGIIADTTKFCLSCHDKKQDKSNLIPPYVKNSPITLAGGDFAFVVKSPGNGHSVEENDPINALKPPGGEKSLDTFTCLSCHSPHNNGNYRNLRMKINGKSTVIKAVADKNYVKNRYISGMSDFCVSCHTRLLEFPLCMHGRGTELSDWSELKNPVTRVEQVLGKKGVFCLSCHYAHAGPYLDAGLWDYRKSYTGCLECHEFLK